MSETVIAKLDYSWATGESVRVPIAELINTLTGSTDSDAVNWFEDIFITKVQDVQMPLIIESLLENGLQCPLNIVHWSYRYVMGNGHHRLVAALLCGIEEVDVYVTPKLDYYRSESTEYNEDKNPDFEGIWSAIYDFLTGEGEN